MNLKRKTDDVNNSLTRDQRRIKKKKCDAQQNHDKNVKASMKWKDDEIIFLLHLYDKFIQKVGQDKMFSTIEDLWIAVGLEITNKYGVLRSSFDCENKFNILKFVMITSDSKILAKNCHISIDRLNGHPISTNKIVKFEKWIQIKILENETSIIIELMDFLQPPEDNNVKDENGSYIQDNNDLQSDELHVLQNQENNIENEIVYNFSIKKDIEDFVLNNDIRLVKTIYKIIKKHINK